MKVSPPTAINLGDLTSPTSLRQYEIVPVILSIGGETEINFYDS